MPGIIIGAKNLYLDRQDTNTRGQLISILSNGYYFKLNPNDFLYKLVLWSTPIKKACFFFPANVDYHRDTPAVQRTENK